MRKTELLDKQKTGHFDEIDAFELAQIYNQEEEFVVAKVLLEEYLEVGQNYYPKLMLLIEVLEKLEEYEELMKILAAEVAMPYIPKEYEDEINNKFRSLVKVDREAEKISEDNIEQYLSGNELKKLQAIDYLSTSNIHRYLPVVREFFLNDCEVHFKTLMLEVLVEQQINEDFKIKLGDESIIVNPYIYERNTYDRLIELIINDDESIDVKEIAKEIALVYYMNHLIITEDIDVLYSVIIEIAKEALGMEIGIGSSDLHHKVKATLN